MSEESITVPPVIGQEPPSAPPPTEIHGFPLWIKVSAVAVAVLVVISIFRMVPVFQDALAVERAHKAVAQGNPQEAAKLLGPVFERNRSSTDLALDLADSQIAIRDYRGAEDVLQKLQGREMSTEQSDRANVLAQQLSEPVKEAPGGVK